jgi:hypothetical protein
MTPKFRLKPEARQFFDKKYHYSIHNLSSWKKMTIPEQLLSRVENVYIDYGLQTGEKGFTLSGYDSKKKEAYFEFTVRVLDTSSADYRAIDVAKLMDELQKTTNKFFKQK